MIYALRKLGLGCTYIVEHLNRWDHSISISTAWRYMDKIDNDVPMESKRSLCGRKSALGKQTVKKMVNLVL